MFMRFILTFSVCFIWMKCSKPDVIKLKVHSILENSIDHAYLQGSQILMVPNSPRGFVKDSVALLNRPELIIREDVIVENSILKNKLNELLGSSSGQNFKTFDLMKLPKEVISKFKAEVYLVSKSFNIEDGEKKFGVIEIYSPVCVHIKEDLYCMTAFSLRGGGFYGNRSEYQCFKIVNDELLFLKNGILDDY